MYILQGEAESVSLFPFIVQTFITIPQWLLGQTRETLLDVHYLTVDSILLIPLLAQRKHCAMI